MNFIKPYIFNFIRIINKPKIIMDVPVVVIVGATGTGKSKLAIDLALKFNGEIISADSMQVYKNLNIVTNKVTDEERNLVPHHLIDFLDPLTRFSVVDFRNRTLQVINSLIERNKLPLIVGGTNYYIESILWNVLINNDCNDDTLIFEKEKQISNGDLKFKEISKETILNQEIILNQDSFDALENVSNEKLHEILQEIDPVSSMTLHPNERRKVFRSLQVYQQIGRPMSELLAEQRSQKGGCNLGGPLRFKNSLILWVQCEEEVLNKRLDERVDQMIEIGLIQELLNFHENYNKFRMKHNLKADYTRGIFQTIGFKEFHEYLIMDETKRKDGNGVKLLEENIEQMKLATRKYARKQIKWIKNRFLRIRDRQVPSIFGLNATDLSQWDSSVLEPSISIVNHYLYGTELPSHINSLKKLQVIENEPGKFFCQACDKTIYSTLNWKMHLDSRHHRQNYGKLMKKRKQLSQLLESLSKTTKLERRHSL